MGAFDSTMNIGVTVAGLVVVLGGAAWLMHPANRPLDPIAETAAAPSPEEQKSPRATSEPPAPVLKAQDILAAMNTSRVNARLMPLAIDERLAAVAQEKLDDMLRRHYFDHQNPEGKYIWDTLRRRCAFRRTAENLARGIADAGAMESLMSSLNTDNLQSELPADRSRRAESADGSRAARRHVWMNRGPEDFLADISPGAAWPRSAGTGQAGCDLARGASWSETVVATLTLPWERILQTWSSDFSSSCRLW